MSDGLLFQKYNDATFQCTTLGTEELKSTIGIGAGKLVAAMFPRLHAIDFACVNAASLALTVRRLLPTALRPGPNSIDFIAFIGSFVGSAKTPEGIFPEVEYTFRSLFAHGGRNSGEASLTPPCVAHFGKQPTYPSARKPCCETQAADPASTAVATFSTE